MPCIYDGSGYKNGLQLGECFTTKKAHSWIDLGGTLHLLPKFEHIFVAVITFFPFLLYKYF